MSEAYPSTKTELSEAQALSTMLDFQRPAGRRDSFERTDSEYDIYDELTAITAPSASLGLTELRDIVAARMSSMKTQYGLRAIVILPPAEQSTQLVVLEFSSEQAGCLYKFDNGSISHAEPISIARKDERQVRVAADKSLVLALQAKIPRNFEDEAYSAKPVEPDISSPELKQIDAMRALIDQYETLQHAA